MLMCFLDERSQDCPPTNWNCFHQERIEKVIMTVQVDEEMEMLFQVFV